MLFSKEFESKIQHDKLISELSLSGENNDRKMQLVPIEKQKTKYLGNKINAYRRLFDMDASEKQNFTVSCNQAAGTITITGNLYNALNILKENDVISTQFAEEIEKDISTKAFIEKTKSFVLPENKEGSIVEKEESIRSLQKPYVKALAELDKEQFEKAIQGFVKCLHDKGKKITISNEGDQNTIKISNN